MTGSPRVPPGTHGWRSTLRSEPAGSVSHGAPLRATGSWPVTIPCIGPPRLDGRRRALLRRDRTSTVVSAPSRVHGARARLSRPRARFTGPEGLDLIEDAPPGRERAATVPSRDCRGALGDVDRDDRPARRRRGARLGRASWFHDRRPSGHRRARIARSCPCSAPVEHIWLAAAAYDREPRADGRQEGGCGARPPDRVGCARRCRRPVLEGARGSRVHRRAGTRRVGPPRSRDDRARRGGPGSAARRSRVRPRGSGGRPTPSDVRRAQPAHARRDSPGDPPMAALRDERRARQSRRAGRQARKWVRGSRRAEGVDRAGSRVLWGPRGGEGPAGGPPRCRGGRVRRPPSSPRGSSRVGQDHARPAARGAPPTPRTARGARGHPHPLVSRALRARGRPRVGPTVPCTAPRSFGGLARRRRDGIDATGGDQPRESWRPLLGRDGGVPGGGARRVAPASRGRRRAREPRKGHCGVPGALPARGRHEPVPLRRGGRVGIVPMLTRGAGPLRSASLRAAPRPLRPRRAVAAHRA